MQRKAIRKARISQDRQAGITRMLRENSPGSGQQVRCSLEGGQGRRRRG